jgi:hypothetical protein
MIDGPGGGTQHSHRRTGSEERPRAARRAGSRTGAGARRLRLRVETHHRSEAEARWIRKAQQRSPGRGSTASRATVCCTLLGRWASRRLEARSSLELSRARTEGRARGCRPRLSQRALQGRQRKTPGGPQAQLSHVSFDLPHPSITAAIVPSTPPQPRHPTSPASMQPRPDRRCRFGR